jgi:hypothetical protein
MSETYTTKSGQKVTTHYDTHAKNEETIQKSSDRAAQNRKIRDESGHAPVESYSKSGKRPDRRENLPEEESEAEPETERKSKKKSTKQHREPGPIDNLGRNVSGYISRNNGQPSWLFPKSGKKGKDAKVPEWIVGGSGGGKMPSWVLGEPAPWEEPKKATPRKARRVPAPKSTRPAWIRW